MRGQVQLLSLSQVFYVILDKSFCLSVPLTPSCHITLPSLPLWDIIKRVNCPDFIVLVAINISQTVNFMLVRVHFVRESNRVILFIILYNRAESAHDFAEIQIGGLWCFGLFLMFVFTKAWAGLSNSLQKQEKMRGGSGTGHTLMGFGYQWVGY